MRAIVVSTHPDDETLGAGGTIMKLLAGGGEVVWLNITNMKEEYGYDSQIVSRRAGEIERVRSATGYSGFYDLGLRPSSLEQYAQTEIIAKIRDVFEIVRPETVFLPYLHDAHSDHRVVYECALACTKSFRAPYIRKVLCMETISETDYATVPFRPDCYVDIGAYVRAKAEIAAYYESEIQDPPFPRSREGIFAQARFRGGSCCREYAEAFQLVKEVIV